MTKHNVCHYSNDLTRLYRAFNTDFSRWVHYRIFEIDCLGFYLYVSSEEADSHEHESSLRSKYGEYPVYLGKTPEEARTWIMAQRPTTVKRGNIFSRLLD